MTGYRLELLGGFSLSGDAGPLVLSASAQHVVAFVALAPKPVSRSRLAGTIWPDARDEGSRARLRSVLWRLKRDGHHVVTGDDRIALAADVSCDLVDARATSQRVLAGQATDDDLHGALDWVGDLLPEWQSDWVVVERERERQRTLYTLEARSAALLRDGRHAEAADTALSAVLLDPLRETARRALIEVHLAEQNVAAAVLELDRFSRRLAHDLGVGPSEALTSLVRRAVSELAVHR